MLPLEDLENDFIPYGIVHHKNFGAYFHFSD